MKKHNSTNRKLVGRRQRRRFKWKPLTKAEIAMYENIETIWREEDKRILEMLRSSDTIYIKRVAS